MYFDIFSHRTSLQSQTYSFSIRRITLIRVLSLSSLFSPFSLTPTFSPFLTHTLAVYMTLDNLAGVDAPPPKIDEDNITLAEAPDSIINPDMYELPNLIQGSERRDGVVLCRVTLGWSGVTVVCYVVTDEDTEIFRDTIFDFYSSDGVAYKPIMDDLPTFDLPDALPGSVLSLSLSVCVCVYVTLSLSLSSSSSLSSSLSLFRISNSL